MTNFLINRFIQKNNNPASPESRAAYGKLAGTVGIFCNMILFTAKITAGLFSGSVSITADAVNNLSDASSSIISLFGFKLACRPADEEHPYGHGRYEYLAGLMVAFIIMVIGAELLRNSVMKIIHPTVVEFSWLSVGVLSFSILLKLWMMIFNNKVGRIINSKTLFAAAADSRNDVITTAAVLIAALLSRFTTLELDGIMGVLVALFILYSGFGLVRDTLDPMLGKAPDEELVNAIREKILSYSGVLGTHDLMVHDYGPGRQFASVHVEMAAEDDPLVSHEIIDSIERDFLKNDGLHMIVHYDPISTKDSLVTELREWISEQIKFLDARLSIHDLRIVKGKNRMNVIFDCVVPNDMQIGEKEIKCFVNNIISEKYPEYTAVITIDRSYAALPHEKTI
ncbi:MAG: cation transporter [Clostridia bacterium]|nr:cation transporter [Clostridia bacterium]NDO18366.1 cation transporter [Lachnospiraceae bacterium MD329]